MMDPYYKVKSDIHQRRPAYGIFMCVWTIIMGVLSGYFGYYAFNVENNVQCFVKGPEQAPIFPIHFGVSENPDVADVSNEFDEVISMFFLQSVAGGFIGFYNVLAIFVFPVLLKYSYPVGIFNKLNLAFGAGCMLFMHIVRLSHAGKVCSGDFLTTDQLA